MIRSSRSLFLSVTMALVTSCGRPAEFAPVEVVDLGALVTDDLPQRMWGEGTLKMLNFTKQNSVELIRWALPVQGPDTVRGSNAYYTLFNHGGPHVDAPIHVGLRGGVDSYRLESFSGAARVFDVRGSAPGRSIPVSVFQGRVRPGDIVLILTGYRAPTGDAALEVRTLTHEPLSISPRSQ